MSFASPIFLWCFMPAVLAVYLALPPSRRNLLLAVASLVFYAYGAHGQVVILVACIAANYGVGLALDRPGASEPSRNALLALAVVGDVGTLAYWKYSGFLAQQAADVGRLFGAPGRQVAAVALPIGISFFTFHHLSYVIDVWRRTRPALRHPVDFVTYIAMFPQLIAGPIVRYHEIADQLPEQRQHRLDDIAAGFPRFAWGLAKKVVVADSLSPLVGSVFGLPGGRLTTSTAWLGALAYTAQLYFDFSGYTDMAIGLGHMFGFRLPENFDRPYSAVSMTDFWRRWHQSLSRWFRDYLYIPLGGNRGSAARTTRNLLIVFALTGLWHGAAWTFLLWGLYHGGWLIWERGRPAAAPVGRGAVLWGRARTFLAVVAGWVLFRADDLPSALRLLWAMVWPHGLALDGDVLAAFSIQRRLLLAGAAVVVFLPGTFVVGRLLDDGRRVGARVARLGVSTVGAAYAFLLVSAGTFSPFLYYRF